MNKKFLSLLLFLCFFMLSACASFDDPSEVTDTASNTISANEPSQNTIESSYDNTMRDSMSRDEFVSKYDQKIVLEYDCYIFVKSENSSIVAEIDTGDYKTIKQVQTFAYVTPEANDFSKITVGMNVFEVVEKVGLPSGSETFGLSTLDFKCSDNTVFRICWTGQMTVLEVNQVTPQS